MSIDSYNLEFLVLLLFIPKRQINDNEIFSDRINLIFDASALTSRKKIAYEASFSTPYSISTDCTE